MLCFRDQAVPALSDTALLANPSCCSLVKCFMSINVGIFYEVHTQPYDLHCSPTASFAVFPRDEGVSEALAGRSQWAERLLDLASSDCRELREIFTENSFPGNLLGI